MNPISTINKEPTITPLTTPIIATLRSSNCVFEVRCEATKEWLSPAFATKAYYEEAQKKEMRETLKKAEYQFHKVTEEGKMLWVTPPIGFWLRDGRLVSDSYKGGDRVKPYYGTRSEIQHMNRKISYILDGESTFLPKE